MSYVDPRDVTTCHQIGQSVMLDNGAYSMWTKGITVDWGEYYDWCDRWLEFRTSWAIIPDVIDGDEEQNNQLIGRCKLPMSQSAPVWHLHEPLYRILNLMDMGYRKICFGSSGEYATIGTSKWHHRITEAFNLIINNGPIPWVHMLRGMSLSGSHYPFSSVDSSDIARHHNTGDAVAMVDRWDKLQCPAHWKEHATQQELLK